MKQYIYEKKLEKRSYVDNFFYSYKFIIFIFQISLLKTIQGKVPNYDVKIFHQFCKIVLRFRFDDGEENKKRSKTFMQDVKTI